MAVKSNLKEKGGEGVVSSWWGVGFALTYVVVVLVVDTLAVQGIRMPFDWRVFRWRMGGFDLFKFIAWFVIPFLYCLRSMEWGWFGVRRWRRMDVALLGVLAGVGVLAVLAILVFPSLQRVYHGVAHAPFEGKIQFVLGQVLWVFSWLVGWEFLHRYFLLRPLSSLWPRYGWLVVPLSEGIYHLQKPLLEALGMVVFSLVLTAWAFRRQNALLPFLAHLFIELELILFLLFV